jgi:hypothetical protein
MSRRLVGCLLAGLAVTLAAQEPASAPDARPAVDRRTGLVRADGFELIVSRCTRCHTARIITQTRSSREQWLGMIRWMQLTQGLEELEPGVEAAILDYLERHYGIEPRPFRRAPLPPELLPPAPDAGAPR